MTASGRSDLPARCAAIALAACLFAACLWSAVRLGMAEQVHLRYTAHAFPAVLSHLHHGLPWDYTAYEGIARFLVQNSGDASALERAAGLTDFDRGLRFFPYDDKGYAVLALLGFDLFGTRVAAVFWAYALLLGASLAVFLIAMRKDVAGLVLALLVLAGLHASLPAYPVSTELGSVTNPRAMGALSFLALAHLLHLSFTKRSMTILDAVAAVLQGAIVAFVVFARSPEIWQVGMILAVSACALLVRRRLRRCVRGPLIAACAIVVCMAGSIAHQRAHFHPVYFETHGQTRLMWHNAGIGFALNPSLAAAYDLRISDQAMFDLVAARARAAGIHDEIFTDGDTLLLNPVRDFVRYDALARDIVIEIVREHPLQAVATFALHKPRHMARTFLAAMGFDSGARADFEVTHLSAGQRADKGAFLSLFRVLPLCAVILGALVLRRFAAPGWTPLAAVIGLIWAGSMIPAFASYPLYHVVGSTFATTSALAYVLLLGLLLSSFRIATARRAAAPATAAQPGG